MKKSTQKTTPVQTGFYVLFFVILISKYIEDITALYDEVLKGYADNRNGWKKSNINYYQIKDTDNKNTVIQIKRRKQKLKHTNVLQNAEDLQSEQFCRGILQR